MKFLKKFPLLALLGFVAAVAILLSYFTFFVFKENIRDDPTLLLVACGGAALLSLGGVILAFKKEDAGWIYKASALFSGLLALAVAGLFTSYVYYFARILPAPEKVKGKVQQPAPDFTLKNTLGEEVTLSEFEGKKNVLLVFYRGHW